MQIFVNPNYNFLKWRFHAIAFSVAFILIGLVIFMMRGPNLGIDFAGGADQAFAMDLADTLVLAGFCTDGTANPALARLTDAPAPFHAVCLATVVAPALPSMNEEFDTSSAASEGETQRSSSVSTTSPWTLPSS